MLEHQIAMGRMIVQFVYRLLYVLGLHRSKLCPLLHYMMTETFILMFKTISVQLPGQYDQNECLFNIVHLNTLLNHWRRYQHRQID